MISNQILRKYGRDRTKSVHRVPLIVPAQGVKLDPVEGTLWIPCLKIKLSVQYLPPFQKVNQVELDKEFAFVSVTVPEPPISQTTAWIGVDLNATGHAVVVANPQTGKVLKLAKSAQHLHQKYARERKRLQARRRFRRLKLLKRRESNRIRDLNHKASRAVVDFALASGCGIRMEDLKGIRQTKKQVQSFKHTLHSWSPFQFQQFVGYKAKLLGVPVELNDPAYTSKLHSRCGRLGNRSGKVFFCPTCAVGEHADINAAFSIALRWPKPGVFDPKQKEMFRTGALIPSEAALRRTPLTAEPPLL